MGSKDEFETKKHGRDKNGWNKEREGYKRKGRRNDMQLQEDEGWEDGAMKEVRKERRKKEKKGKKERRKEGG